MSNKQGTEKEIIHISDGNLSPCDFCGVSFSHKHKAGSLPKEFEMIEDKSQVDTPGWEEMKGQMAQGILGKLEYRGFYDAGKYLDGDIIEAIEPFIHNLLLQAKEQEKQEIVEMVRGMQSVCEETMQGDELQTIVRTCSAVIENITQRGTKSSEK